ncbi:hypothetical protein LLH00_02080, partial [bacterium]|nr:hypothetical protein [bacterium]
MPPLFRIKSLLPVLVLLFGQATSGRLAAQDTWYAAYGRAMDDIAAGRWQEAVQNLDAALQLKPGPEVNARTYGNWRPDYLPHYYLGLAWFNLGQYEKAQAEFNLSLQAGAILHAPELHEALLGYMRSVEDRLESGRQEKQNQEHVNAEITRALEFERQGDLDEARNRLETAMNLDPENETVKEHLRRVTDSIHLRDEQARQQQVDRLLNGAVRSLEKGALEAARDSAERALALAPLDARILNVLEKVEQRSRQLSAAEDDRLLAADSLLARGRRTLEQGRLTEAGRDLRRALQLDPRNRQAREYSLRVDSLIAAQARSQRQGELIREASLLLDRDSLIFARDRLIRARELGPDPLVDSLMSRVEQRLAERERLSREREAPQLVLNLPSDSTRRFTR